MTLAIVKMLFSVLLAILFWSYFLMKHFYINENCTAIYYAKTVANSFAICNVSPPKRNYLVRNAGFFFVVKKTSEVIITASLVFFSEK